MTWARKYWDTLEQLYWTPKYLGLNSISKKEWGQDQEFIKILRKNVQSGGSIYTRKGTSRSNLQKMRGLEETLNHIFDITFCIAPDAIVSKLLAEPAGLVDDGPFESVGREIKSRFGWGNANVTQQDGLFVSPQSILNVELKLGSKTWREQVLKYIVISLLEERNSGRRSNVGLLYITPYDNEEVMEQAGANMEGQLPPGFVGQFEPEKLNATARKIVATDLAALEDVASRIQLTHISWSQLIESCDELIDGLNMASVGDQSLARLLQGFTDAVRNHQGTGF